MMQIEIKVVLVGIQFYKSLYLMAASRARRVKDREGKREREGERDRERQ